MYRTNVLDITFTGFAWMMVSMLSTLCCQDCVEGFGEVQTCRERNSSFWFFDRWVNFSSGCYNTLYNVYSQFYGFYI